MKNKKNIIAVVVIALAVGSGILAIAFNDRFSQKDVSDQQAVDEKPVNKVDYGGPKEEDKIKPSAKDEIINGDANEDGSPVVENDMSVSITQATQREDTVYIRALVNGANSGTCSLTFTKKEASFKKEVPIGVQASYSICQGFNVPAKEFPESGEWEVEIVAKSDDSQASANTKVVVTK